MSINALITAFEQYMHPRIDYQTVREHIRLLRFDVLIDEFGIQGVADRVGVTQGYVSQISKSGKQFNEASAIKFARAMKLKEYWFDLPPDVSDGGRPNLRRKLLSRLRRSSGGFDGIAECLGVTPEVVKRLVIKTAVANGNYVTDEMAALLDATFPDWRFMEEMLLPYEVSGSEGLPRMAPPASRGNDTISMTRGIPIIDMLDAPKIHDGKHGGPERYARGWVTGEAKGVPRAFAVPLSGDAMVSSNAAQSYPDGAYVIIDPDSQVNEGQCGLFGLLDDKVVTFSMLISVAGTHYLRYLNSQYPVTEFKSGARCLGVLVGTYIRAGGRL